jgi:hypothetical protein
MRTYLAALVLFLAAPLAACTGGDDDDGSDLLFEVPDPPAGGIQIATPPFTVPGSSEVFMCMRIPYEVTEDLYIQSLTGYQAEGGHHSLIYYVDENSPNEEAPHECNELDMADLRFVGVGTGYGHGIAMPPGKVLRVPAGKRIFVQSHYLNLEAEERLVQDVLNIELTPAEQVDQVLGSYANVDLTFELPPNQETTRTIECSPPTEITVPWMLPHMHEWGSQFKLEVEFAEGGTQVVFDDGWDAALRDDFPILDFEPHLTIGPDDVIRTTCTWQNTEAQTMLFPKEMCATFMVYYPSATGSMMVCDESGDNFEL